MKQARSYDALKALPLWVVVRTATGKVRERGQRHTPTLWSQMGSIDDPSWEDEDFPVQVLWSYAQEIYPPLGGELAKLVPSSPSSIYPYPQGGMVTTTTPGTIS